MILIMAPVIMPTIQTMEMHYPGEPWTIDELERIPHLHCLAKSIRDRLEVTHKTLRDIAFQNKQNYENFMALFNSDIVFRLKYTHEYYLLAHLFQDPKEKARLIQLFHRLRARERDNSHALQASTSALIKAGGYSIPLYSAPTHSMLLWAHPAPDLSHMEKWCHYEQEWQRISSTYHVQKIEVRNHSLHADRDCIQGMMTELNHDIPHNRQRIEQLTAIKRDIDFRTQHIMSMPTHKADGTLDAEKVAIQEQQMERLQKEVSSRMDAVFGALGNDNPAINELRAVHAAKKAVYDEELLEIDRVFAQQKAELMPYLQQARADAQQNAWHHLGEIIQTVKNSELPEAQRQCLDSSIKKLENHQKKLAETKGFAEIQAIMQDCKQELVKLEGQLPVLTYEKIKPEVIAIEKMVVESDWMQPPPAAMPEAQAASTVPQTLFHSEDCISVRREQQQRYRQALRERMPSSLSLPDMTHRESALKIITIQVDNALGGGELMPDTRNLIAAIKAQISMIKEYTHHDQEVPEVLHDSLMDNLRALGDMDDQFNNLKEKYADVFMRAEEPGVQLRN